MGRVLVVAALAQEVVHVRDVEVLVTGVGKVMAATALSRRVAAGERPELVVNLGTAGGIGPAVAGLREIGYVTQHDFPYDAVEALVGPVGRGYVLHPRQPPTVASSPPPDSVVLATGDAFVADAASAAAIAATGAHLVDMEAFAYAATCAAFGIPMLCVKAVSDAGDAGAGVSWLDSVDGCARALAEWLSNRTRDG